MHIYFGLTEERPRFELCIESLNEGEQTTSTLPIRFNVNSKARLKNTGNNTRVDNLTLFLLNRSIVTRLCYEKTFTKEESHPPHPPTRLLEIRLPL